MNRFTRILVTSLLLVTVLLMAACDTKPTTTPTGAVTPTAGATVEATPTPDIGALFLADVKTSEAAILSALNLSLDFCKSVGSAWYDAESAGNDGLVAATAFVATDASKAKIAQFQTAMDALDVKVTEWKGTAIPDSMKAVVTEAEALLVAVKAMKAQMTTPTGTMEAYQAAYQASFDAAKGLYDKLVSDVTALG
jgi:hypothetical protein